MSVLMHRLPHARAKAEFEDTLRHTTGQRAKDVMHADALVLREDEGLGSVVPRVLAQEGKAVPVVDSDERLVGVLDRSHLLWAVLGAPESWPIG
jgi:CBS-domain-containing membrane protein